MNIRFIHHYAIPPHHAGGTRHFSVAKELVRRGHNVTILAADFVHNTSPTTRQALRPAVRKEVVDGVTFVWLPTISYARNSARRVINMLQFGWFARSQKLLRELPPPDVVLGSSPQPFAALAASLVARQSRCRFVYEVRDIWPQTLVELGRVSRLHPLVLVFSLIERWCARRADLVISLLPNSIEHLTTCGADPARLVWIPNGVDLDMVGDTSERPPSNSFDVVYAGAHGAANNLETVIHAAAEIARDPSCAHIRVRLIGDGPERTSLQALATRLGVSNVIFESAVPKSHIYAQLRTADAFIMILRDSPVFHWGISPNKLFDYMAVGRPIIFAVNTPKNPVAEARAGISADPASPSALADSIKQLALLSAEERRAMGSRARQYVRAHHDVTALAQTYATALTG